MADKVRWGVLSTARIARNKVIPAMQGSERCDIRAIASRDKALGRAVADELGIPVVHDSYEALLADPDIEAIYNPLPNHLHVPLTIKAAEAGKHVLCEKPIALSADEARTLLEVRDRTGVAIMEAFMVRFHPQWLKARDIVRSGQLGDVRAIQTFFCYNNTDPDNIRNKPEIGGGAILDIGCYAVVTGRMIFEAEPERVMALIDRDPVMGIDRMTSGMIAFPGNRHLTFTVSTQLAPHQRVTVAGTAGRLEVVIPFNAPAGQATSVLVHDGTDLTGRAAVCESMPACDQYAIQGDIFSRVIRSEIEQPYPLEDAVTMMEILDGLFRSAESGRWERLKPLSSGAGPA